MEEKHMAVQETKQLPDKVQTRKELQEQLKRVKQLMDRRMETEQQMERLWEGNEESKLHKDLIELSEQLLQQDSELRSKGKEKSEVWIFSQYTCPMLPYEIKFLQELKTR